jgi:hypothetical protein
MGREQDREGKITLPPSPPPTSHSRTVTKLGSAPPPLPSLPAVSTTTVLPVPTHPPTHPSLAPTHLQVWPDISCLLAHGIVGAARVLGDGVAAEPTGGLTAALADEHLAVLGVEIDGGGAVGKAGVLESIQVVPAAQQADGQESNTTRMKSMRSLLSDKVHLLPNESLQRA